MKHAILIGWLVMLVLWPAGARAESPEQAYQTIFGEEDRKVSASPGTKDDAEFAAKLLAAVDKVIESNDLKAYVCKKAYEFGMKDRAGLGTAIDAAKRLAKLDGDHQSEVPGDAPEGLRPQASTGHRRREESGRV